jgi:ligand-binding sensor domain-containing protein
MKQERNPNSLSDNWVGTMYEHPPGTLWIGTRNGLNKFDPATERFEHFFEQDGLP